MNTKLVVLLFFISILFISSCRDKPIACPLDTKICPDGSVVGRVSPNCKFEECPMINNSEIIDNPQKECERLDKSWKQFSNGCVDSCAYERNPEIILCTAALTMGCDCGPNMCWNGETCEPN